MCHMVGRMVYHNLRYGVLILPLRVPLCGSLPAVAWSGIYYARLPLVSLVMPS